MVGKFERASDAVPLVGVIDPDAYGTGDYVTGWIDMREVHSIMAVVFAGTLGTSATIDAKLVEATDGSGTGPQDITGKAITQLVKASNDDDQAIILCNAEDLDLADGYTHVQLSVTVGTATSDMGAAVFGWRAHTEPATDLASVVQIVS